jgi:hypothetical protein
MTDPYCDCGACCTACGHDPGCMSLEVRGDEDQQTPA